MPFQEFPYFDQARFREVRAKFQCSQWVFFTSQRVGVCYHYGSMSQNLSRG